MSVKSADAAEQVITGWSVGVGDTALCTYCKSELSEGDNVTVYGYRCAGEQLVSVVRLYCAECDRRAIDHPACGFFEWLAEAHLALTADVLYQSHSLTLAGVEIIDESGPKEGDEP